MNILERFMPRTMAKENPMTLLGMLGKLTLLFMAGMIESTMGVCSQGEVQKGKHQMKLRVFPRLRR